MESKPLVSVITPAYNTGEYIASLLDSILMHTYSNIEIFVIDDGSTDNTGKVVESFKPRFKEKEKENVQNYFLQLTGCINNSITYYFK